MAKKNIKSHVVDNASNDKLLGIYGMAVAGYSWRRIARTFAHHKNTCMLLYNKALEKKKNGLLPITPVGRSVRSDRKRQDVDVIYVGTDKDLEFVECSLLDQLHGKLRRAKRHRE